MVRNDDNRNNIPADDRNITTSFHTNSPVILDPEPCSSQSIFQSTTSRCMITVRCASSCVRKKIRNFFLVGKTKGTSSFIHTSFSCHLTSIIQQVSRANIAFEITEESSVSPMQRSKRNTHGPPHKQRDIILSSRTTDTSSEFHLLPSLSRQQSSTNRLRLLFFLPAPQWSIISPS